MSIAAPRFQCIETTGKAAKAHPGKPSLSATMQKSKIPTNTNQSGRTGLLQTDSVGRLTADDSRNTSATLGNVKRRLRSHSAFNESSAAKSKNLPSTAAISVAQKRLLENDYTTKKKKYAVLRKELVDKQKTTQELYESINRLREKVISLGSKDPGKIEEPPQVNLAPAKKGQTFGTTENIENGQNRVEILTQEFIKDLETSFQQIPESLLSICQEALTKRTEIISWLTDFGQENTELNLDPEIEKQLSQYKLENTELESRFEEVKRIQDEFANRTKILLSEIERLKNQDRLTQDQLNELRLKMEEIMTELVEEREKYNQIKEKKTSTEVQLQKAKNRIKELEVQVASNENRLSQLQNQIRQKETGSDQKAREMQRSLKNNEGLVAQLEKQRESLESRLIELKKDVDNKQAEINEMTEKFEQKIHNINLDLDEQKKLKKEAEVALNEAQERCLQLEKKCEEMCELVEKSKKLNLTDGDHKENETRLRNELESLRATLTEKDEKLERLNREKEEIVAVMHQAANEDNEATREKLAAKLVMKTNELQALRTENAALRRRQELAQEKDNASFSQLAEINRKLSHENGKAALSNQTIEVQQQIADLRNALSETVRRNEELQKVLVKKEIVLEKRNKDLREQSKILRVRDELIGLIKGGDQRSNGSNINELREVLEGNNRDMAQVNKQIAAKAEQLRELFSTLEYKQIQIRQLETMVMQMDEQQERAQAQRTRLENRIAQLELALMGRNKERYVEEDAIPLLNLSSPDKECIFRVSPRYSQQQTLLRPSAPPNSQFFGQLRPSSDPRSAPLLHKARTKTVNAFSIPTAMAVERGLHHENNVKYCREGKECPTRDIDYDREAFYNWLMGPSTFEGTRKLVKHSKANYNGEPSRAVPTTLGMMEKIECNERESRSVNRGYNRIFRGDSHSPSPVKSSSPHRHTPPIRVRQYTT